MMKEDVSQALHKLGTRLISALQTNTSLAVITCVEPVSSGREVDISFVIEPALS